MLLPSNMQRQTKYSDEVERQSIGRYVHTTSFYFVFLLCLGKTAWVSLRSRLRRSSPGTSDMPLSIRRESESILGGIFERNACERKG
ncbi:MAG: hypothetical protein ACI8W8_001302 [Rhodothermales bacterium]|jgi:hypothetical protein